MKKNKGKIVIGVLGAVAIVVVLVALMTVKPSPAVASQEETGNGAPSGWHFTLNILGKDWEGKDPVGCGEGHRIFVKLGDPPSTGKAPKTTRIYLSEGPEFRVLDCDGTDGRAEFQLPDPNGGNDRCTAYSVFVRALGKPGGKAVMTTCASDPCTGEEICSEESVVIERTKGGKSKFVNVSKELLTICAYVCLERDPNTGECIEGDWMRLYLFDPLLEDYLWKYNNNGLRHAQLRFYLKETCYTTEEWDCKGPAPG
ncbi:MAG: hypothetical protein ACYSUV_02575 [Planctomycetota bacterium]|jgi:hypothetical protein